MRIVLSTRSATAGADAGIVGLARRLQAAGVDATLEPNPSFAEYDVALFLGYDHELERARAENPSLRVGLVDPKQSRPAWVAAAREADFLLVCSVEQREAFLRLNRNILVHYLFPLMPPAPRAHVDAEPLVIGYHGNRVHLECFATGLKPALELLGRERPVELLAVYDIAGKGRVREAALPDPAVVPTIHVQYDHGYAPDSTVTPTFYESLVRADIGVVPNLLPLADERRALRLTASLDPQLAYEPFDHLTRFKASSNPNRLFPFAQLGIPVVADFTPSFAQFVLDGVSGALVRSGRGWYEALARLGGSTLLRTALADELRARLDTAYERQLDDLLAFLDRPVLGPPPAVPGARSIERDLADLAGYAAPTHRPARERLRARLRRFASR
jgi:glycosyltransferase involved in cell wall biosynthesis